MKENIEDLGPLINDNENDDVSDRNSIAKINQIDTRSSKTKKSKERLSLQKSSNLQEIDDFLVVLDNSEEYKKMILEQAKNKVRRVIRKIKETKDINKLMNDLTETKKYIITPDNKLMPYFNYLIFILLYIDIIISPFEYFVYCNPTAKIIRIVLFDLIFSTEIVLTIFTSYYDVLYKHYVTDIKKIFRNYLWNGFIPNFIYVFPFYLFNHNLEIIRILKIYRYPFISSKSKESLSWILSFIIKNSVIISQITRVIIFFLSLCYILHVCACFYCFLGFKYTNSWVWQYPELVDNTSILDVYVSSYYFITETFSSTGYGDLTPINSIEIIFIMFCQILNCGLYAYLLSNILDILTNKENSDSYKYRADQTQFEQWITFYIRRLPTSSKMSNLHRNKIWNQSKRFYELYYNNTKNFLWLKDKNFFIQMKPQQRNELLKKAFDGIFKKFHHFFNEIVKLSSKINIIFNFNTSIQVKNTEIIRLGKHIHKICFIDRGEIDIYYKKKKINTLKEGDIFGLEGILQNYNKSEVVYKVNEQCNYTILFTIEIGLLIEDILNYDGESFANLNKIAQSFILKNYRLENELEIINEEKKEDKEENNEDEHLLENDNKDIITTSINDNEEIINKSGKNKNIVNIGRLSKLNDNLEQLEKAKHLINESDLRINLIDKQINFINNYFTKATNIKNGN